MMAGTWGIIQARMGSTRLAGKVLQSLDKTSLLGFMLKRLQRAQLFDGIVVATTTQESDEAIVAEANNLGVTVVRGDENNVLSRYILAIDTVSAEVIVRMTSDCPLIDPEIVDHLIAIQRDTKSDYVSNNVNRTGYPRGMDVEVFPTENLRRANQDSTDPYDREHVTPYLYRHPEVFRCLFPLAPPHLKRPQYRLCVDEQEDLDLVRAIVAALGEDGLWGLADIIAYLDANPDVAFLNRRVDQKPEFL